VPTAQGVQRLLLVSVAAWAAVENVPLGHALMLTASALAEEPQLTAVTPLGRGTEKPMAQGYVEPATAGALRTKEVTVPVAVRTVAPGGMQAPVTVLPRVIAVEGIVTVVVATVAMAEADTVRLRATAHGYTGLAANALLMVNTVELVQLVMVVPDWKQRPVTV